MSNKSRLETIDPYLKKGIRGTLYWIGWRRTIFKKRNVTEGGLVETLCQIISANLPKNKEIQCEVDYDKIELNSKTKTNQSNKKRMDLVISSKKMSKPVIVMEIKRYNAGKKKIKSDIEKLHNLKTTAKKYLLIFSEHKRPPEYTTKNGKTPSETQSTKEFYNIIWAFKVSIAFDEREKAHYAVLLEIT